MIIPTFGWRPMFAIAGIGALIVWYLRKRLPESPRWLESQGRADEAEALMQSIEREVGAKGALPAPIPATPAPAWTLASLFTPALLPRLVVGSVVLITVNTLIFGFVNWIPTFFVQQGLSLTTSFVYALVIALGSPLGCAIGAFTADRLGRRACIIGASVMTIIFGSIYPFMKEPALLLTVGFFLIVGIYILTAFSTASTPLSSSPPRCACAPTDSARCSGAASRSSRRSSSSTCSDTPALPACWA